LSRECPGYLPTQFFPSERLGATVRGVRNEDLGRQTFADSIFELVITLDVMEHVNEPDRVMREVARTLVPGGSHVFTVPTYKGKVESERRARYLPDGIVEHLAEPEYHGNPVSDEGSLVTFHYGYDLPELIHQWSGLEVEVVRFHDHRHGLIGDMTEVYIATRPGPRASTTNPSTTLVSRLLGSGRRSGPS
jgi:SAM-dependent methyltransferase